MQATHNKYSQGQCSEDKNEYTVSSLMSPLPEHLLPSEKEAVLS